jgi:hypothetical protein
VIVCVAVHVMDSPGASEVGVPGQASSVDTSSTMPNGADSVTLPVLVSWNE